MNMVKEKLPQDIIESSWDQEPQMIHRTNISIFDMGFWQAFEHNMGAMNRFYAMEMGLDA